MTKSDITKSWGSDMVKLRNGQLGYILPAISNDKKHTLAIYMKDLDYPGTHYELLSNYNEDFIHKEDHDYDVIAHLHLGDDDGKFMHAILGLLSSNSEMVIWDWEREIKNDNNKV